MKQLLITAFLITLCAPFPAHAFMVEYEVYCPDVFTDLKKGDTDATTQGQVSRLQRFLNTRISPNTPIFSGLPPISGVTYGIKTERYVKLFQKSVGLQGLGMVGPKTRSKIAIIGCGATTVRPEKEVPRDNMGTGTIMFGEGVVVDSLTERIPQNVQQYAFSNGVQKSDIIKLGYVNGYALLRRFASVRERGGVVRAFSISEYPGLKVYVTCGWQSVLKKKGELADIPDSFGAKCNPFSIGATDGRGVDIAIDQGAFN